MFVGVASLGQVLAMLSFTVFPAEFQEVQADKTAQPVQRDAEQMQDPIRCSFMSMSTVSKTFLLVWTASLGEGDEGEGKVHLRKAI